MEEQEHAIERERRRISELQLGRKNMINRQFMGYGMEELSAFEGETLLLHICLARQLFRMLKPYSIFNFFFNSQT